MGDDRGAFCPRWTGFLLLIALSILPISAELDKTPYEPGTYVKRYQYRDFGYVDGRDSDAYTEDVAIRVIPILACAILVPLFFFLWSCGRCCTGCCPCCRPKESSKTVRLVLLLLIFLAAMASLGILAYGFAANDHQSETITDVPKVLDLLVAKQDSILALSNTVRVETVDFDSACNDAIALGAGAYSDGTTLTKLGAFKTAAAAIEDARVSIDDAIRGMDIKSSRDSFSDNVLTLVYYVLILIAFVLAATLLAVVTVSADYCIVGDNNTLALLNSEATAEFYVTCDESDSAVDPNLNDKITMADEATTLVTEAEALRTSNAGASGAGQAALLAVKNAAEDLKLSIGVKDANSDNFIGGWLSVSNCVQLNELYQAVMNLICGDAVESFGRFFEVFIALAVILFVAELLKLKLDGTRARVGPAPAPDERKTRNRDSTVALDSVYV